MSVKVITDSASNLSNDLLAKYNIDIVSMFYRRGDQVIPCYNKEKSYDELGHEFYEAIRNGESFKTSLPAPQDFVDCFEKYLKEGYDVFFTSISSKLSGCLNSAKTAKEILEEDYPERKIVCMDSFSASFGEAIIAIEAAKKASEGKTIDEIVDYLEDIKLNVRNEFTVENLTYLKTGGRIQSLIYNLVNLLDIKVMLRASHGAEIELCGKAHGRKKSLMKLAETVKKTIEHPEDQTLYLAHCDCEEDAKLVEKYIKEAVPTLRDIYISFYDFCTGAHVGPGTIAVFYFGKKRPTPLL